MKYKYNGQWVDVNIKALDSMAIGSIIQFVGTTIPTGWLECDGSTITQSAYPELYDLIGGTLPDFRGKVLVGQDTNDTDFDTLLETGGSKELQEHTHNIPLANGGSVGAEGLNDRSARMRNATNVDVDNFKTTSSGSGNSGNLQPYAVVKHIIKATNTTPTMASVVNATNSSTTDTYSCDYINDLVDYSTTETKTGKKWIDGKPIYRKVVESTITGTSQKNMPHNITNLDNIISVTGSVRIGTTNEWFLLPMSAPTDGVTNYGISIQAINSTNIVYFIGAQMGTYTKYAKAIIEYTKTTD